MTIHETLVLPPERTERWELARQMGVEHAVTRLPSTGAWRGTDTAEETDETEPWEFEPLMHLTSRFEDARFDLMAVEDIYPPLKDVRLGTNRERGVETMCRLVENLGAAGVPLLCYTWSPGFNWVRTSTTTPARGGSLTSSYDHDRMRDAPSVDTSVTEETLWENLEFFLERVVPVAEEAGVKLALHPDDPPVSPIRGYPRILTDPDSVDKALGLVDSDHHGLTFCQGTFGAMGVDMPETIRRFANDVHYVHFRDVDGSAESFVETWHDDGPTDMAEALETWHNVGFDGPMRPDHVPTMAGESNDTPGYEMKGRLFAIGYMRGLLETIQA
jgi:mannonate dehydratase